MPPVLYLPNQEDFRAIQRSINVFLTNQNNRYRDAMLLELRSVLDKYKVSKIQLPDFSIHRTVTPGLSYIQGRFEALDRYCPGCGSDLYHLDSPVRILSILEGKLDKVTYGCRCGMIFFRLEKK